MTFKIYGLKNCDTCRKAKKALEAAGKTVEFVDIRGKDTTDRDILRWRDDAGWETLLNTRSTTWRGLTTRQKSKMDEDKALKLMEKHRALIKRPVIEWGQEVFIGWKKDVQEALL
jgi:arsenate reductase